ncbi:MAG: hypothetical protein PVJ75_09900, partial [Chloroflexota bacterium]
MKTKFYWPKRPTSIPRRRLALIIATVLALATAAIVIAADFDFRDVTGAVTEDIINDAIFRNADSEDASGSGVFDSILRIGANKAEVKGYNTDAPVEPDAKSGAHTYAIRLSGIPIVSDDLSGSPRLYREL